ncbi:hypothetical protein [Melittangium boletus]|uniref:Lipoprotein n=1 Tax=Melittangium boletus DSM 14713 TaxID=1294270 RepID=A0A250IHC2_9BACT|nr:hypothetical protein [Melittangium boletus]ATB30562.1 hypothetical protein MEBOL_004023 [Melittangium boletus DSM 14713]
MKRWVACVTVIGLGSTLMTGCGDKPAEAKVEQGPYAITKPQPLPPERGVAPFGVGPGTDNSGMAAREQLQQH